MDNTEVKDQNPGEQAAEPNILRFRLGEKEFVVDVASNPIVEASQAEVVGVKLSAIPPTVFLKIQQEFDANYDFSLHHSGRIVASNRAFRDDWTAAMDFSTYFKTLQSLLEARAKSWGDVSNVTFDEHDDSLWFSFDVHSEATTIDEAISDVESLIREVSFPLQDVESELEENIKRLCGDAE